MSGYCYLGDAHAGTKISSVVSVIRDLPILDERMIQRGVIADSTAVMQFTEWKPTIKGSKVCGPIRPTLVAGKTYNIQGMKINVFRGLLQANLTYTRMEETLDIGLDIKDIKSKIPVQWLKCHKRRKTAVKLVQE